MGQNWNIPPRRHVKKQLFEPRRRNVVGRLDQHIARIGQREQLPTPKAGDEVRNHMIVRAGDKAQGDAVVVEHGLELLHRLADLGTGIVVNAGEDVGGASHMGHAVIDEGAGHGERDGKIRRPVIDARKDVAVQVNHLLSNSMNFR